MEISIALAGGADIPPRENKTAKRIINFLFIILFD